MSKLSIVIPVYNEKDTITELIKRVESFIVNFKSIKEVEYVVVDDGSTDGTKKILEDNYSSKDGFILHCCNINRGKGAAIRKGFSLSTGDIVIIQDADLEYSPSDYPALINPIIDGNADVVYGSRFRGETTRVLYFWHYVGNRFLTLFSNMLTNINLSDMETCYKVFKGEIIRDMILVSDRFNIEPEITAKIARYPDIRIYEVPISYYGRKYKDGKKIKWTDGVWAIMGIIYFNLFWSFKRSFKSAR